jgi:hypothetical protein
MKGYFSLLILLKLVAHLPLIVSAYPVGLNLGELPSRFLVVAAFKLPLP